MKNDCLGQILNNIPGFVYWKDCNSVYQGCNMNFAHAAGLESPDEIVGKTDYELAWGDTEAELYRIGDKEALMGKTLLSFEETQLQADGKQRTVLASKIPFYDNKKKIIGVLGVYSDITDRKENEINKAKVLQLENEALHFASKEQEKFKKVVGQMMHDITSPITSINTIVSKLGSNIPENDRVTLRNAADRIEGISTRLLNQYANKNVDDGDKVDSLLVSLAILQIMNEKKEAYYESGINFVIDIDENARFSFIEHNAGIFKRMISNLVNNAVDALLKAEDRDQKTDDGSLRTEKKVTLSLSVGTQNVVIIVEDNGPGMPKHIQDMFNQGTSATEGKGDAGHGIGLTQVHDAITLGNGRFEVYANDNGTQITMYFPFVPAPHWIATEIKLNPDDTILILDDDESIHGAWENKFDAVLDKIPTLHTKHFGLGKEVIEYINNLTPEQKQNTFLLTDYELLEQGINGLDVIEQTKMLRAILVTSYATQVNIQERVTNLGIKALPKELVSSVSIKIDKKLEKGSRIVDMVWVEDQEWLMEDLIKRHYTHLTIDKYYDPISFMESVIQYPLNTRIILDTFYESPDGTQYRQTGYDLAKSLHDLGYTKLILYAGEDPKGQVPEYLQVVRKNNAYSTESLDKI